MQYKQENEIMHCTVMQYFGVFVLTLSIHLMELDFCRFWCNTNGKI